MSAPHLVPTKFLLDFELEDDDDGGTIYAVALVTESCKHFAGLELVLGSIHSSVQNNPELFKRFRELMRDTLPTFLESVGGKVHAIREVDP